MLVFLRVYACVYVPYMAMHALRVAVGIGGLAKNPTSSRNRHLDTRTQFVRDAVDYLQITPLYTPTDDQPAGGLTKAAGADVIRRHLPYYTGTCACPHMHNIYT